MGATARALIKYLKLFDCEVRVWSDYLSREEAESLGVAKVDMADVLRCKIVSLHRELSDRTYQSFGAAEVDALLPGSVLINIARGKLIDTDALVRRLRRNDLFACLDVFEEEPLGRNDVLRSMPNVFLTSHIAALSEEAYDEAAAALAANICDYLDDKPVGSMITDMDFLRNTT